MEARLLNTVAIVNIDPGQAEEWFELVKSAYGASNDDWDAFSERLRATAGSAFGTTAEEFLRYAADHGKIELISSLVADARELSPAATEDGVWWDAVVQQLGKEWAGWDGSEAGWAEYRDWTYTAANAQDPEMYAVAYDALHPLGERPLAERIVVLADLGFTITAKPTAPAQPSGLPWDAVVQQFGADWAGWDGSDTGWAEYRDWTYTAANTRGPEMYAAAYEKLNPLNALAPAERIAKVAQLGLGVDMSEPADPAAESAALAEGIERAIDEALKEIPGSEALTAEELAEIRAALAEEIARVAAE
jgi:hypothetical protein